MSNVREFDEEEMEFLLEVLTFWRENGPPRTDEEILDYLRMKHYLETGEEL